MANNSLLCKTHTLQGFGACTDILRIEMFTLPEEFSSLLLCYVHMLPALFLTVVLASKEEDRTLHIIRCKETC
mgnify:CR=1 FL=1